MTPVTPDIIAAAWSTWHSRHGGKLGPGPAFVEAIEAAMAVKEANPKPKERPWCDDEDTILRRLAEGDTIHFSQDGDMAWFTKGDKAFVGDAIMSLREKGYLSRRCDDEENYRGLSEYDTISEAGKLYLEGKS